MILLPLNSFLFITNPSGLIIVCSTTELSEPVLVSARSAIDTGRSILVMSRVRFTELEELTKTSDRMILSFRIMLAMPMPYAAVRLIPMTTRAAPTTSIMYPLFNIFVKNYRRVRHYYLLFFQTNMQVCVRGFQIH
jgi:hypothetical protein